MANGETAAYADVDETFAEFQERLNLVLAKARSLWKDAAARIHPDLLPSGYKLVRLIARAGGASVHRVAACFEMEKSVVSRQVRMLEDLGLLESRPEDQDGRQRVLTATPGACEALDGLKLENAGRLRGVLDELTLEEMQAASKVFRLIAEL